MAQFDEQLTPSVDKVPLVALAGNPNSGKTTLFNRLTGSRYKVANYPGVTIEKREGSLELASFGRVSVIDLPGIYSLSGISLDERIAAQALFNHGSDEPTPDVVIVVVDSTNIERNLYLVSQLIDCELPIIVALNMADLAEKQGIQIHREILSRELDLPVVSIVASSGKGFEDLQRTLLQVLETKPISKRQFIWLDRETSYAKAAQLLGSSLINHSHPATAVHPITLGNSLLSEALTASDAETNALLAKMRAELAADGVDSFSYETTKRYGWINSVVRKSVRIDPARSANFSHQLDQIITHKFWGTLIFILMMGGIFQSIFVLAQPLMNLIDNGFTVIGETIAGLLSEGMLRSLIVDGVVAGVGSVVIFVPQIAILFLFLGLLEDSGYLTRAAYLMDRLLRPVGLQGRSFIPLLSSFACAIPGILSTRTIPSWSDRITTIMIAPLMSCSARLPVYTVLIAAFIPNHTLGGIFSVQGLALLSMYLLGIFGAAFVAWILKFSLLRGKPAIFVMEMPPFRLPASRVVLRQVYDSVTSFLKNAGTTILACAILLWFLLSYPRIDGATPSEQIRHSYGGQIGMAIEPIIKPLGYNWELGVSLLASFAAREVFVTSLATVYNLEDSSDSNESLIATLRRKNTSGEFTQLTALSLMVFYVFACQCMSTLAVTKRETGSWLWTGFMFCYMTALAYIAALVVYQGGLALGFK